MTDPSDYPSRAAHERAWEALAQAVAANAGRFSETPDATAPAQPGDLTIIGSGIETVGFTLGDEALIRDADAVFFCVADPATAVWIKSVRPDAYDLYVLYDDSKVRYTTYMQMTEAMLHFVRLGKRVVAIFYGHPGIFVLSTHRAIMIARREGHHATMRPSVCALDCLCADLGVDPCHPGMQTHEATDMLIRGRVPDTSLHVVLWQVGLIGEMGYRRKGYLNKHFSLFIEYLQRAYGDHYPVTNYVASRYPTIDPLIERYPLSALHDPRNQARITGVSTFYLAPKEHAPADRAMLTRLGLLKPGQQLREAQGPLREIGKYGPREQKAFSAFARFRVPQGYHWQEDTGASRFLIALREDLALRRRYLDDPQGAVSGAGLANLGPRARRLLASRDAGAIQVAAKGYRGASQVNRSALIAIFKRKPIQLGLLKTLRGADMQPGMASLAAWAASSGLPIEWEHLRADIDLAQRDCLFPWTGIYHGQDSAGRARLLVLTGDGQRPALILDGVAVAGFAYRRGVLEWRTGAGVGNGYLRADVDARGRRRLIGELWDPAPGVPAQRHGVFAEVMIGHRHPAYLVGAYGREVNGRQQHLDIAVVDATDQGRVLGARLDGRPLAGALQQVGSALRVGEQRFMIAPASGAQCADASVEPAWQRQAALAPEFCGTYDCDVAGSGRRVFEVRPDGLRIDGTELDITTSPANFIRWAAAPAPYPSGRLTLLLDPITLCPFLFGSVQDAGGEERRCFGRVPPPADLRRDQAELGLPVASWRTLVALAASTSQRDNAALWYRVEKASLASTILNAYLAPRLP